MTQCAIQTETNSADRPSMRRGACPSLGTPMATGDGLLVRLRPAAPGFSLRELSDVARAATRRGNGILEVTARGNLQIRGLTANSARHLAEDIADAGIAIAEGPAIETPPLSGLDETEIADPSIIAATIRAGLETRALRLAPKLSVTIDGGGLLHLGGVTADIRLQAERDGDGVCWLFSLAGTETTATPIGRVGTGDAAGIVLRLLSMLSAIGPQARGRNLDLAAIGGLLSDISGNPTPSRPEALNCAGIHDIGGGRQVLGAGLAFGQIRAEALVSLLDGLRILGATDVRLAPGHCILFLGIAAERMEAARSLALGHGLRVFAGDPRNAIAACAGIGACASAGIDTHALARLMVEVAPELLDGSAAVHLSGCAKGCARPSPAALTITAAPIGYGLVVNGVASAAPIAYIEKNRIRTAVERLGALVGQGRRAGESAQSCLTRLGPEAIAAAVQ